MKLVSENVSYKINNSFNISYKFNSKHKSCLKLYIILFSTIKNVQFMYRLIKFNKNLIKK